MAAIDADYPYDKSMARATKEFEEVVDKLWPIYKQSSATGMPLKNNALAKATSMCFGVGTPFKFENQEETKLYALREIVQGTFWHATDYWDNFTKSMPEIDQKFYANLVIEQAKRAHLVKNPTKPGFIYGNCWIVENYNDGALSKFVDEKLLKESVNRGFWEMVNEEFVGNRSLSLDSSLDRGGIFPLFNLRRDETPTRFSHVMKHVDLLDLTRVNEFYKEPLNCNIQRARNWICDEYINAFEKAAANLDIESAGKLARPIIHEIFTTIMHPDNYDETPDETLSKKLAKYEKYMKTDAVQTMLGEDANYYLKDFKDSRAAVSFRNMEILLIYMDPKKNQETVQEISRVVKDQELERAKRVRRRASAVKQRN